MSNLLLPKLAASYRSQVLIAFIADNLYQIFWHACFFILLFGGIVDGSPTDSSLSIWCFLHILAISWYLQRLTKYFSHGKFQPLDISKHTFFINFNWKGFILTVWKNAVGGNSCSSWSKMEIKTSDILNDCGIYSPGEWWWQW